MPTDPTPTETYAEYVARLTTRLAALDDSTPEARAAESPHAVVRARLAALRAETEK